MGTVVDRAHMVDTVSAAIETVPTDPVHPCPECGSETVPHGEAPRETSTDRVCSSRLCREVQPAPKEVPRNGANDGSPRFPCRKCGKETLLHKSGRTGGAPKRVCSNRDCRTLIDPA